MASVQLTSDKQHRAQHLRQLLQRAAHAYYVLDAPILEDTVYDQLFRELEALERAFPQLRSLDSPTQRVGGAPASHFPTVEHRIPFLSLKNGFDPADLHSWVQGFPPCPLVAELKLDGVALALSYEHGILVRAALRGDGQRGEDITAKVKEMATVPLRLDLDSPPEWLEVRGEVVMLDDSFAQLNAEREALGQAQFSTPRNACAATLRQLDPKVVADRELAFLAYTVHGPAGSATPRTQWDALKWLKATGFLVSPTSVQISNLEQAEACFAGWEAERHALPFATDGVVFKINDLALQAESGSTETHPRWALALKFAPISSVTRVVSLMSYESVDIAEVEPVTIDGLTITRVIVPANYADDLFAGDTITVRKLGDSLPRVASVLKELRP